MRLLALLTACLFAGSVMAEDRKDEKKVKDEEAIVGTWQVEAIDTGGSEGPPAEQVAKTTAVFTNGGKAATQIEGALIQPSDGEYKLDPTANVKTIDYTNEKTTTLGIYRLEGDSLTICLSPEGAKERPSEFKAIEKQATLITLKRVRDEKDKKKLAEPEWAKEVAVDFIKAIQSQQYTQAHRLLTPELAKQCEKQVADAPSPLDFGRFATWEFDADKVSPDKDEVVVRGRLKGKDVKAEYTSAFSIRVVKATDPGRWRIDFFVFEKCKEVPANK